MTDIKYVDPTKVKMIDLVKDNKVVRFVHFRDEEFWYQHQDGLMFPISLKEATTGRGTFLAEDKAIYFMRWMKKYIEDCKNPETGEVPKQKIYHSFPRTEDADISTIS